jgi:hypothetical protein
MAAPDDDPNVSNVFRSDDEDDDSIDIEDLNALAEEVVKLLKRELQLENERRGWHRVW